MHSVLETVVVDATGPIVVGVVTFLILAAGLAFVREVGKFRPNSR